MLKKSNNIRYKFYHVRKLVFENAEHNQKMNNEKNLEQNFRLFTDNVGVRSDRRRHLLCGFQSNRKGFITSKVNMTTKSLFLRKKNFVVCVFFFFNKCQMLSKLMIIN